MEDMKYDSDWPSWTELMKKFMYTRAEKNDSYWGVEKPLEETKDKFERIRLSNAFDVYNSGVSASELAYRKVILKATMEAYQIHKLLQYTPKPKNRTVMEMVHDFFSLDNNPIAFQIRISQRIKDLNHKLDQILEDVKSHESDTKSSIDGKNRNEHPNQYNASHHSQSMYPKLVNKF